MTLYDTSQPHTYQVLDPLADDIYAALKEDICVHGVLVPVEVDEHGMIIDGHHRVLAWHELRAEGHAIPDYPRVTRIGLTEDQKRAHARKLNLIRRHLNTEQKRVVIKAQLQETPETSNRQIAALLGVSHHTVNSVRTELESGGQIAHLTTMIGADGKSYPRSQTTPIDDTVSATDGDYDDSFNDTDALSPWEQSIADHYETLPQLEMPSGLQGAARALLSSSLTGGSDEWYTPSLYVDRARDAMGSIDLDPASCEYANDNGVQATHYYTKDDDGIAQQWHGNVWCNPPYGKQVPRWVARIIEAYTSGEIVACCLLVNATTDVQWFQPLWEYPICFLRGRVPFYNDQNADPSPTHGSVIVYFGEHASTFMTHFADLGRIVVPAGTYSEVVP